MKIKVQHTKKILFLLVFREKSTALNYQKKKRLRYINDQRKQKEIIKCRNQSNRKQTIEKINKAPN